MSALVKPVSWLLGIVLLVMGILGFFLSPIFGLFDVNMLHNMVHIASGAVGLIAASISFTASRVYLMLFGVVYGVVTIAGFFSLEPVAGMLLLNSADNFLHLAIATICLIVGFGSKN